jgi:hypothetical protein
MAQVLSFQVRAHSFVSVPFSGQLSGLESIACALFYAFLRFLAWTKTHVFFFHALDGL